MDNEKYLTRAELVDTLAEEVHITWMADKRTAGVYSRFSDWGEEFMVPYAELSERAKDLDRSTVNTVLDRLAGHGVDLDRLVPVERA